MIRAIRGHWQLAVLVGLIVVLWQTPAVLPLKILIVFLHELAHAVATVLTGGSVVSMTVDPQQGGMVVSRGGSRFLTLTAGYLGSLLIGVALFMGAVRTRWDRLIMGAMGALMLLVTALYLRDGFAIGFGAATGFVMLLMARFLPRNVNDLMLRVIGLCSMIYVPLDIYSDTIARSYLNSDARMLAEEFGGPTLFWGGAWLVISVLVIFWCLRRGLGASTNIAWR